MSKEEITFRLPNETVEAIKEAMEILGEETFNDLLTSYMETIKDTVITDIQKEKGL